MNNKSSFSLSILKKAYQEARTLPLYRFTSPFVLRSDKISKTKWEEKNLRDIRLRVALRNKWARRTSSSWKYFMLWKCNSFRIWNFDCLEHASHAVCRRARYSRERVKKPVRNRTKVKVGRKHQNWFSAYYKPHFWFNNTLYIERYIRTHLYTYRCNFFYSLFLYMSVKMAWNYLYRLLSRLMLCVCFFFLIFFRFVLCVFFHHFNIFMCLLLFNFFFSERTLLLCSSERRIARINWITVSRKMLLAVFRKSPQA